jgi:hypothetical protein
MLAEGVVDTKPNSDSSTVTKEKGKEHSAEALKQRIKMKPNPMNEKNRERIEGWKAYIAK